MDTKPICPACDERGIGPDDPGHAQGCPYPEMSTLRARLAALTEERKQIKAAFGYDLDAVGSSILDAIGDLHDTKALIEQERDAAVAREKQLRTRLRETAPWYCPECGDHVKIDDEGCCVHCGEDTHRIDMEGNRL